MGSLGLGGGEFLSLLKFTFLCIDHLFEPIWELEEGGGGGWMGFFLSGFLLIILGFYLSRLMVVGG